MKTLRDVFAGSGMALAMLASAVVLGLILVFAIPPVLWLARACGYVAAMRRWNHWWGLS